MARRRHRRPRAGKFGPGRVPPQDRPGARSPTRTPYWPVKPGQTFADKLIGPYWRDHGVLHDPPRGGGGGGGGGQAILGPPPGTYDPQLDASLRASERGLGDFKFDTRRQGQRALEDYTTQRWDAVINRGRGREDLGSAVSDAAQDYRIGKFDIGREYGRIGEDIGRQRGYAQTDHDRAIAELARQYQFLGNRQSQQARAAGVMEGGYAAQAAEKRKANQAFDRVPIDTSLGRALGELGVSQRRATENRDRAMLGLNTGAQRTGRDLSRSGTRMEQDFTRLLGQEGSPRSGLLYQGYQRGVEDRTTGLARAMRENREFGQDILGSKYYQARYGAGTLPVWRPRAGGPRKRDPYAPPRRRGGRR